MQHAGSQPSLAVARSAPEPPVSPGSAPPCRHPASGPTLPALIIPSRSGAAADMLRVGPRDLRPKQEYRRGIVNPEQDQHERSGGAVGRGDAASAEVEADHRLADGEQDGGDGGAKPEIRP